MIGKLYKYYNSNKVFKLKQIRGFIYEFECGHCCTDNVFKDLIQINESIQLKLF